MSRIKMARSIEEMASTGADKLQRKAGIMRDRYARAKPGMIASYDMTPFGPEKKARYKEGVNAAEYRAPDADTWKRNWIRAMSR